MPHQYHPRCNGIVPHSLSFADCRQHPAVVVTSFANPSFYGRRLRAMLGFAKNYFPSVLVITPGYLYRHAYNLLHQEASISPLLMSLRYERHYIEGMLSQQSDILSEPHITQKRWFDFVDNAGYQDFLSAMQNLYNTCSTFQQAIDATTQQHLQNNVLVKHDLITTREVDRFLTQHFEEGVTFLLEELAMSLLFVQEGYRCILYPGKLFPALERLILGQYPDEPEYFTQMIQVHVALRSAKRSIMA